MNIFCTGTAALSSSVHPATLLHPIHASVCPHAPPTSTMSKGRVLLAYSGGLGEAAVFRTPPHSSFLARLTMHACSLALADTSVILAWLNEQGYEVIAFSAPLLSSPAAPCSCLPPVRTRRLAQKLTHSFRLFLSLAAFRIVLVGISFRIPIA